MKVLGALGTGLSRFVAFVLAAVFVFVTVAVLLAFNSERLLLSAATYQRALVATQFYEKFPGLMAEELALKAQSAPPGAPDGPPAFARSLSAAQWEQILRDLFPPDLLQRQVEAALDQAFAFLDAPSGPLRLHIPLGDFKLRVAGEPGQRSMMTILRALPPCAGPPPAWTLDQGLPDCRPSEAALAQAQADLPAQLQQLVDSWPDEASPQLVDEGPASPRQTGARVRQALYFSPLVLFVLLGLVTVFGVRSLRSWLGWWGWPLLVAALIALPLGLFGPAALNAAWNNQVLPNLPPTDSVNLFRALFDVAVAAARTLAQAVRFQSLVMGAVGLLLVLASFFVRPNPPAA
jgi:hypothetical protein